MSRVRSRYTTFTFYIYYFTFYISKKCQLQFYTCQETGGVRLLGIPTILDRMLQQAIAQRLSQHYDPQFSDYSYGFRPNRSCHDAIDKALDYLNSGHSYVVEIDLSKFFDRVNVGQY